MEYYIIIDFDIDYKEKNSYRMLQVISAYLMLLLSHMKRILDIFFSFIFVYYYKYLWLLLLLFFLCAMAS